MIDELFCSKCGKLKRKCKCKKEGIRKENIKLLKKINKDKGKISEDLKILFDTDDRISFYKVFEPYNPEPTVEIDEKLPIMLQKALIDRGITKLYPFQQKAIELTRQGKNVVITAPTGFGKTEAFTIPVLESIFENGRAMIIYPTKALAKDQERKIKYYANSIGLATIRFDGDSNPIERNAVFSGKADIILSNPDMIDYHLRNSPIFRRILKNLRFLVVDELHSYNGLFGSNLYFLFERLQRLTDQDLQIACASATISNSEEFAESLFDKKFFKVNGDHRKGILHFIMRYTPNIYSTIKDIVKSIPSKKTLIFGNSYKSVETISWVLNREGVTSKVHKAGLPNQIREEVEAEFRKGKLKVVISTPTLELGVDIGDVEAVISELVNYSHFLQRVGRAGRNGQESIGILLLRKDDAISTYYKSKPEDYFKFENSSYIERRNEEIMKYQILSMCMEKPLSINELKEEWANAIDWLLENKLISVSLMSSTSTHQSKELSKVGNRDIIQNVEPRKNPHQNQRYVFYTPNAFAKDFIKNFSMRGIGESVKMVVNQDIVGERSLPIALKELFPGSIILHNGKRFRSLLLDLEKKEAILEEFRHGSQITEPLYNSTPVITSVLEWKDFSVYCALEISMTVYGYIEKDIYSQKKANATYFEPITYTFPTKGFVFSAPFPPPINDTVADEEYYAGSFHALEHVLIESSNALTGGGSNQIGGISTPRGDIFIYDATIGGSGLSKLLFNRFYKAVEVSGEVLRNCDCGRIDGCPGCTYSYQCGNNNQPLNKLGAIEIIKTIIKGNKRKIEPEKYDNEQKFKYYA